MNVFLVIQIIIVTGLIISILMQKSSADGFTGGGSGASGGGSLFSSRGKANALTRSTAILATVFIINSLILAYMASHSEQNASQIDQFTEETLEAPTALETEALKTEDAEPTVPMAE